MSEAGYQLKAYVERIERIDDERDQLSDDKRVVYAEAKAGGFTPKAIRAVVRRRAALAKNRDAQLELEALYETYLAAIAEIDGTPPATRAGARDGFKVVK